VRRTNEAIETRIKNIDITAIIYKFNKIHPTFVKTVRLRKKAG